MLKARSWMMGIGVAAALLFAAGSSPAVAQQSEASGAGTEIGNFGELPFHSVQIVITRPDDRVMWRTLEDKHLKELRELEDKYERELRVLRVRQAEERDTALKSFRR